MLWFSCRTTRRVSKGNLKHASVRVSVSEDVCMTLVAITYKKQKGRAKEAWGVGVTFVGYFTINYRACTPNTQCDATRWRRYGCERRVHTYCRGQSDSADCQDCNVGDDEASVYEPAEKLFRLVQHEDPDGEKPCGGKVGKGLSKELNQDINTTAGLLSVLSRPRVVGRTTAKKKRGTSQ